MRTAIILGCMLIGLAIEDVAKVDIGNNAVKQLGLVVTAFLCWDIIDWIIKIFRKTK